MYNHLIQDTATLPLCQPTRELCPVRLRTSPGEPRGPRAHITFSCATPLGWRGPHGPARGNYGPLVWPARSLRSIREVRADIPITPAGNPGVRWYVRGPSAARPVRPRSVRGPPGPSAVCVRPARCVRNPAGPSGRCGPTGGLTAGPGPVQGPAPFWLPIPNTPTSQL